MDMKDVESSNIASIGYDADRELLMIRFHSGGTYKYTDVPQNVADELIGSDSIGKYFHKNIKNVYEFDRVV